MKHFLKQGDTYHSWTVIEAHNPNPQSSLVQCSCGEQRTMRNWNLIEGSPSKCKKCYQLDRIKAALIPVGTQYGDWTIISDKYEKKNSRTGGLKQEVVCKCGYTRFLELYQLKVGKTVKCLMCASRDRLQVYKDLIPIRYVKRIEYEAVNRGLLYDLTLDYLYNLYNEQKGTCAISGMILSMPLVNISRYEKGKKFNNSKDFTASLDRIDSKQGYIEGNVQWVHKLVNRMKMDLDEVEFFSIVKQISKYKQL